MITRNIFTVLADFFYVRVTDEYWNIRCVLQLDVRLSFMMWHKARMLHMSCIVLTWSGLQYYANSSCLVCCRGKLRAVCLRRGGGIDLLCVESSYIWASYSTYLKCVCFAAQVFTRRFRTITMMKHTGGGAAFFPRQCLQCMCVCDHERSWKLHWDISLERVLLSALLSLFIETFSLSHRARAWKSNISTKPREEEETGEGLYWVWLGWTKVRREGGRNIGWRGGSDSENLSPLLPIKAHLMWKGLSGTAADIWQMFSLPLGRALHSDSTSMCNRGRCAGDFNWGRMQLISLL